MNWQWLSFEGLTREELFEIVKVRQVVFVVEHSKKRGQIYLH